MKVYFFAGAGLSQAAWDRLERVTETYCGERIRIMAGLGMTETSPSCLFTTGPIMRAGYVGVPAPGCEVKLAPVARQARSALSRPARDGWLLAHGRRRRGRGRSTKKAITAAATPLKFVDPHRPELGFDVRRPHRRGLQAEFRHLRERRADARARDFRRRAVCAGCGCHGHQPRRCRRCSCFRDSTIAVRLADLPAIGERRRDRRRARACARFFAACWLA